MANANRSSNGAGSTTLLSVLIVTAILYFARDVLIPFALAVLFSFLLAPVATRLRRIGFGKIGSVVAVVILAFGLLAVVTAFMASQLTELAQKLPEYQQNIHQKLESIRISGGWINRISREAHSLTEELTPAQTAPSKKQNSAEEHPLPVEIRQTAFSPLETIQKILGSIVSKLLTAGIVVVFVIFMLIQREDLRDRLIRLIGTGRIKVTTQAMIDAAQRLSRYLLAQFVLNVGFGLLVGVGLFFIGVPNPALWAIIAALFRYVPYLGIWLAAVMPAAIALAVEAGWVKVPMIFGLYFGIDLLMCNLVEPLVYGNSTGISPIAILVSAVIWTWLWGPVGLLLATPLTLCVAVLGRHVPSLKFLNVLIGNEPVLPAHARFYQRMLASELDEASDVAEDFLKGKTLVELYDEVIIPALSLAEEERHQGTLDPSRQKFIFENTRALVEDLASRPETAADSNNSPAPDESNYESGDMSADLPAVDGGQLLCLPARDEADEISALMLAQLLARHGFRAKEVSVAELAIGKLDDIVRNDTFLACILIVPPHGYMHARYLCRRLHAQFPELSLIAGHLKENLAESMVKTHPALPAERTLTSLKQVVEEVLSRKNKTSVKPALMPLLSL